MSLSYTKDTYPFHLFSKFNRKTHNFQETRNKNTPNVGPNFTRAEIFHEMSTFHKVDYLQ